MRKLLPWLVLVALLIVSVAPAMALPTNDLNALARYFPDDTAIFFSMQFNEDALASVDNLIARVADALPASADIGLRSVVERLDEGLSEIGMNFSDDIQPWLGDTLAVGIQGFDFDDTIAARRGLDNAMDEELIVAALAIHNAAAVDEFIQRVMERDADEYTRSIGDTFITYVLEDNEDTTLVLYADVLLVTNVPDLAAGILPSSSLADNPAFGDSFDLLPEDEYFGAMYLNLPQFFAQFSDELANFPKIGEVVNSLGPVVGGFTLIDDLHLVLDFAIAADLSAVESLGIVTSVPPLDPAFARFVPANSVLVSLGSSLATQYKNMLAQMKLQTNIMESAATPDSGIEVFGADNPAEMTAQFEAFERLFEEYTGLNLRGDVVSWMTGSYAGFLALNPEANFSSTFGLLANLPIELGVVIEATNPAAAATTVTGLSKGLDRLLIPLAAQDEDAAVAISSERISGTGVTVVSIHSSELPWPIEILLASNDEIFVFGTRGAVTRVLQGDGMMNSSDSFIRAQGLSLENSISFGLFDPAPLLVLTELMESMGVGPNDDEMAQNVEMLRGIINLIDSISVSQSVADQSLHARMVLSLSE